MQSIIRMIFMVVTRRSKYLLSSLLLFNMISKVATMYNIIRKEKHVNNKTCLQEIFFFLFVFTKQMLNKTTLFLVQKDPLGKYEEEIFS